MSPEDVAVLVRTAVTEELAGVSTVDDRIVAALGVERPKIREHGDYATNAALVLAKPVGEAPRVLAERLATRLRTAPGVAGVEVAGPGFLNLRLQAGAAGELAATVLLAGAGYGRVSTMAGLAVNLEFISANPTGPLHLGHARWAALGDALGRVLDAAGAQVTREFYINDRGVQMDRFGASLRAAALGEPTPPDGYHGAYVAELAAQVVAEDPTITELDAAAGAVAFREEGYQRQLALQQQVLEAFRTRFDVWYSERSLHASGAVERALDVLRGQGHVFELDGAVWLRTTDFGDDKDRVLVKADGEYTYFASDCAYYVDKRARGFDRCIYLLGADHHGYVHRLRAVAACAGDDPDATVDVLIGQLVKMVRAGQEVRLSKRAGSLVTLDDLVEEVGVDAARYSLCRYPADSPLTLDLDLITRHSSDNPVYYVQYAHARISSVLRHAADLGLSYDLAGFDPEVLTHERESLLLAALGDLPRTVATAAELREPHRVARYLEDLAGTYHRFYDVCRVLPMGDEPATALHRARLVLCAATRQVLANGLDLLGVSAPERM